MRRLNPGRRPPDGLALGWYAVAPLVRYLFSVNGMAFPFVGNFVGNFVDPAIADKVRDKVCDKGGTGTEGR